MPTCARIRKISFLVQLSALFLVAIMAGCSDAVNSGHPAATAVPSGPVTPVAVPTFASSAGLHYPLSPYMLSDEQQGELSYLGVYLTKNCVTRRGFSFDSTLRTADLDVSIRAEYEAQSRLWGISDAAAARRFGYHLPAWLIGDMKPQPIGSFPVRDRAAVIACGSRTLRILRSALGPDAGNTLPLVAQIQAESYTEAVSSAQVRAAFARWSACMSRYGYKYNSPFAPAAAFNLNGPVSKREIQTAQADLRCKARSNLLGSAYAVQAGYENRLIAENKSALAEIRNLVRQEAIALAELAKNHGVIMR